jgi:hypothetical protein
LRAGAADDGEARLVDGRVGERVLERLHRRLHQRRVERAGDVELERAAAVVAGVLLGLRELLARAAQDHLAGGVVVGDRDTGVVGDLARLLLGGADEREHRARVVRLGHQPAAEDDELERVVAVEHPGGGQRGQLAEAVARGDAGLKAERVVGGDARAEDRGLGEAGALLHARERILPDELYDALEEVGGETGDVVAHLGGLAALTGKEHGRRLAIGDEAHAGHPGARARGFGEFSGANPPTGGMVGGVRGVSWSVSLRPGA